MGVTISEDNIITLTRGDSCSFPLFLNQGSDQNPIRYTLGDNDEVYLGIMEPNQPFEEAIVKKKFTRDNLNKYGDVVIEIEHDDTTLLIPGKYFYQVKAKFLKDNGKYDVNTVIKKTQFIIEE